MSPLNLKPHLIGFPCNLTGEVDGPLRNDPCNTALSGNSATSAWANICLPPQKHKITVRRRFPVVGLLFCAHFPLFNALRWWPCQDLIWKPKLFYRVRPSVVILGLHYKGWWMSLVLLVVRPFPMWLCSLGHLDLCKSQRRWLGPHLERAPRKWHRW